MAAEDPGDGRMVYGRTFDRIFGPPDLQAKARLRADRMASMLLDGNDSDPPSPKWHAAATPASTPKIAPMLPLQLHAATCPPVAKPKPIPAPTVRSSAVEAAPTEEANPTHTSADTPAEQHDNWRTYLVRMHRDNDWWCWDEGIVDLRLLSILQDNASEGTQYRAAVRRCKWVVKRRSCQFKVGMASNLGRRWEFYKEETAWKPTHVFIILRVKGRVAAGFVEAALISMMTSSDLPVDDNMNFKRRDHGGTGPMRPDLVNAPHWIYLAVQPNCE